MAVEAQICGEQQLLLQNNNNQQQPNMVASTALLENQNLEINRCIDMQKERLQAAVHEQRKQHITSLIHKLESRAAVVLNQKEDEIARVCNRSTELRQYMKRMETENQVWRRVTREKESMIVTLNANIERLSEKAAEVEDAGSWCQGIDSERRKMISECKRCKSGNPSVLFLPCRHLCCCKTCEPFLYACPLCKSSKEATIEALLS